MAITPVPERRERLGAAGAAHARDHLGAEAALRCLTEVLLEAVAEQGGAARKT